MSRPDPSSPARKEEYRRALLKVEELHGNMAVLARLGLLLREPDTDTADVARLLQTDGALSANIVRISNSVHFGFGARSTTLSEALVKVGYNRILSLIGAALSKRLFMRDLEAYGMSADDYWAYGYFCAVLLEQHADALGVPADDAYLTGLLHALGRVVINDLLHHTRVEIYWDRSLPCEEWEDILVGFRHDAAGAALLKSWRFSPAVHERVAKQNSPAARAADPLLLLLDYARHCADLNHYRLDAPVWLPPADHPWTLRPGFDAEEMARQVESARQACRHIGVALRAP